ncbi:hypothetical protein M9458_055588, partial [Cirrhinus mrigala]
MSEKAVVKSGESGPRFRLCVPPCPLPVPRVRKPALRLLPPKVDLESTAEEASPQSVQYEEFLEVVTHAVAKLNIDWPAEEKAAPQKSKLDERFLRSKPSSPRRSLPFFPDLHAEIARSWERPYLARLFVPASDYYGNVAGLDERAYKAMPRVEQTLASYLSPGAASSLKAPTLPSKPLCTTSLLVGKGNTTPQSLNRRYSCLTYIPAPASKQRERTVTADSRVFPTLVGPEQALVMEQEVETLLRKEAIEVVPPHVRESGFYSRYFIVPKKDGGLRPIIDLRRLNRSVMKLKFKMLTVKQVVSQIRSEDWFVTIDLKDAYFHVFILPQHRKFLRFAFRGEAYQYRVLPFGLALSPRTKCVDAALVPLRLQGIRILNYIDDWLILAESESLAARHRDVVLAHMKTLGLRLNAKKSVLSPLQRTTYLGVVWDSTTMQARLSPARIESILAAVTRVKEGRSLTVKQFQQLLGSRGSAYVEEVRHVEETLVPKSRPGAGSSLLPRLASDRCIPHRLGGGHEWCPAQGLWSGRHLSWHINCLEMLAIFRALKYFLPDLRDRHVLVRTDSTAVVYYINHQGGLRSPPLYKLAHQILVWSQDKLLSLRAVHILGHLNVGADVLSRQGPEAWGMDASPRGGEADMGNLWSSPSGSLCHEGECTMSPLVLSSSSSSPGTGCHGGGHHPSRPPGAVEAVGVASEGAQLIASGLSTEVVETILQSRAPSARKLYALKWKLFTSWCGERQQDPVNCPVGTVLEFLQAHFSIGLSHSTLKVYVAAISAYHAPLGGMSVGKDPLVVRFLHGVLRPLTRPHVSTWDLAVVLEALCRPPFEPIEEIPVRFLTIKTALLLALTFLKWVGDLQALSVAPSHLEFAPGMTKAFLYPRAG